MFVYFIRDFLNKDIPLIQDILGIIICGVISMEFLMASPRGVIVFRSTTSCLNI